jgi:hypothetical protein
MEGLKLLLGIPALIIFILIVLTLYLGAAIWILLQLIEFLDGLFGFVSRFCKVEIACYAGEPNWLGYLVLAFPFIYLGLIWLKLWWKHVNT